MMPSFQREHAKQTLVRCLVHCRPFRELCWVDRYLDVIFTPSEPPTCGSVSSTGEGLARACFAPRGWVHRRAGTLHLPSFAAFAPEFSHQMANEWSLADGEALEAISGLIIRSSWEITAEFRGAGFREPQRWKKTGDIFGCYFPSPLSIHSVQVGRDGRNNTHNPLS